MNILPGEQNKILYPLSLSQRNIWNVEEAFPHTSINNICSTISVKGRYDPQLLQKAINSVLKADSTLRLRITRMGEEIRQYVSPYQSEVFPVYDFSLTDDYGMAHFEEAAARAPMELFDHPLYDISLFRLEEELGGVLLKTHHLISDGWSQMLLSNRISNAYLALLSGREEEIQIPSYLAHLEGEQAYLASAAHEKDKVFWQNRLRTFSVCSCVKDTKSAALSPVGRRKTYRLSKSLDRAIYAFSRLHRVAPFSIFYMALAIYLKRVGCENPIAIGVPVVNRLNAIEKQTGGMFVSTLPFIVELDETWSLNEFSEHLNENWYDLLRHQRLPFSEISDIFREQRQSSDKLFDIVFSYQDSKILENRDAHVSFSGRWLYSGYQAEHLIIHLSSYAEEFGFSVDYDYLAQLFSESEIDALHSYLTRALTEAIKNPDMPISRLQLLGGEEEERVLFSYNDTGKYVRDRSLAEAFLEVADEHPGRAALIHHGRRTTYGELAARAGAIAAALREQFEGRGEVIGLRLKKGPDLVAGMIGASLSGNAFMILPPGNPENRLNEMIENCGPKLILSDTPLSYPHILLSGIPEKGEILKSEPSRLAYVVYTSGSAGRPKGVEIEEKSLLNFAEGMAPLYSDGAVLSICSAGFDVFMLESVAALLNSRTVILCDESEQENPKALASLILSYGVGFMAFTPSRLSAYLENPDFLKAAGRLESIVLGGEHISGELLSRLKFLTSARIYNQYGPSETTVGVSYKLMNDAPAITIGKPMQNCRLYVLDSFKNPLPTGVYGELYIGGLCVGRGYRNAPSLTEAAFFDSPFEPDERIYRTGDVACLLSDGDVMLLGRKDDQIKLRGQRIEPGEIAMRIAAHPGVSQAAVKVYAGSALIAYYVSEESIPERELFEFSASYLPNYMLPAKFIRLPELPLTQNGKVDYARLPDPVMKKEEREPENIVQRKVLEIFRSAIKNPELHLNSDFFLSGGDSLRATEALLRLEKEFGSKLRITDLYFCRTAAGVAARLGGKEPEQGFISKAPALSGYPLSPTQLSLYYESQLDKTGVAYNMPGAFVLGASVDVDRLEQAFIKLIEREEILRTAFLLEGEVSQRVLPEVGFALERLNETDLRQAAASFVRPFTLSAPPLLRAAVLHAKEGRVLLVDMHHIVSDAFSSSLMMKRLDALYRGVEPERPAVSYADYAYWQANKKKDEEAEEYFKRELTPLPGPLALPKKPGSAFDFSGARYSFDLGKDMTGSIEDFVKERGLSPFMLFTAAFGLLLKRLTGSDDFIIGTPVSGRERAELLNVMGAFISPLPLRLQIEGASAAEYLEKVKNRVLDLLEHQNYTLAQVLEAVSASAPLYTAMLSFRPISSDEFSLNGEKLCYLPLSTGASKLELTLEVAKAENAYQLNFEYSSSLFSPEAIALYARSLKEILAGLMQKERLCDITGYSARDWYEYFVLPNSCREPYLNVSLDALIDRRALLNEEEPAILFHGQVLSFAALKKRSDAIAAMLVRAGAKHKDRVAFCLKRTPDMLASMIGILKAGCSYIPLLSSYPESRMNYMLENAGAAFMLADEATKPLLPSLCRPLLVLTEEELPFTGVEGRSGEDEIHVLYTSGSTGEPKGVSLPHRALSNLYATMERIMAECKKVVCTTNVIFDTFITETLIALAAGKCVVLADEEQMMLPWKMAELILQTDADTMQFTPSRLQMCLANDAYRAAAAGLSLVMLAGEILSNHLLKDYQSASKGRIVNLYGPAETTVYMTHTDLTRERYVTIGTCMPNCRAYILDKDRMPCLPTARGEIYIGGECLANGYVNKPDLTEKAFLPDPFFPGERMYKSGDMARLLADGSIDFLEREDFQVKLNGQRIELSEITGQMLGLSWVKDAATIAVSKADGSKELRSFVVGQGSLEELRAHLKKELPDYMVPSELSLIDAIPLTETGKTDAAFLSNIQAKREITETTKDQTVLHRIWKEVLERPKIDESTSFFEQGGNSLAALNVLGRYFNNGLSFTLSEFIAHPTLKEQLMLLGLSEGEEPAQTAADAATSTGEAEWTKPAATAKAKPFVPSECPRGSGETPVPPLSGANRKEDVLLSGATGYLGAHLLKALCEQGRKVYCLIRGDGSRLVQTLQWYFGMGWLKRNVSKIKAISGDIKKSGLGLLEADAEEVGKAGYFIHAAGDVRHHISEQESFGTNLMGTMNALEFAFEKKMPFRYISTMSVMGEYIKADPAKKAVFRENDFDIGQNWMDNVYVKGKYLAEQQVLSYGNRGLNVRIFRIGRLVGRSSDGLFQQNPESNSFYAFIQGAKRLAAVPASFAGEPIELTSVDACARAVTALLASENTVLHIYNPLMPSFRKVCQALSDKEIEVVSDGAFEGHLGEKIEREGAEHFGMFLDVWNRLKKQPFAIAPACERTLAELSRVGFSWAEPEIATVLSSFID